MNPLSKDDLIEVLENTTLAQLRALRALRRADHRPSATPGLKRKSNMDIVYDILLAAKGPSTSTKSSSVQKKTTVANCVGNHWSAP